ncbi:lysozyme inhibitor LprI family protein [Marinobacter caseinilyticus]|uniref:lysozyme inhibitor LprI family protein n=1 Tax=Marinobacter caseinilyticus TaxID=2692195 RepID=UPI00140E43C5|nr:lysozyme inhibitor LprI family protein [Marinobacter caseinilyticus]
MNTSSEFGRTLLLLLITFTSAACQAIDNPDAPDYLEQFRAQASSYELAINNKSQTTADMIVEYRGYIDFLEQALQLVETALEGSLSDSERALFFETQAKWQTYRQAEMSFVDSVWTQENFGSSASVSKLAFYSEILKSRIELLQTYRLQF